MDKFYMDLRLGNFHWEGMVEVWYIQVEGYVDVYSKELTKELSKYFSDVFFHDDGWVTAYTKDDLEVKGYANYERIDN